MNKDILQGQWKQLKGTVKTQWGKLTDDDVEQIRGNTETLFGKLQERYGRTRMEIEKEVDGWIASHKATAKSLGQEVTKPTMAR